MAKKKENDIDDLVTEAMDRFKKCVEAERDNRETALDAIKFRALEQWPEEVKRERENDPESPRPCLVMDKTNQYIHQVTNDQRQNRPSIRVNPVDDKADPEVAKIFNGIIRNIEEQSSADAAYDTAFEHAADGGFGYFRILPEYCDDEAFYQDLRIKRVRNRFSVYLDPSRQEADGSDSNFGFIHEDMDIQDFKDAYPDAQPINWEVDSTNAPEWFTKDKVRVVEYYKLKKTPETVVMVEGGQVLNKQEYEDATPESHPDLYMLSNIMGVDMDPQKLPIVAERKRDKKQLCWYKLNGKEVLDDRELPGKYIPIVEVIGNEIDIEGVSHRSGLITAAMDACRMYNYAASAFVEMVALAPKAPFIAANGQIEDFEADWAAANRRNIAVLKYKPVIEDGVVVPAPHRQPMPGIPSGWDRVLGNMEHDIRSSMGMYRESVGDEGEAKSGRALNIKLRESDTSTFHFVDNLSRSIRYAGRILVDLIPHYYDTARVARIIGEDGEPDMVKLDPEQQIPVRQYRDNDRKLKKIYNITIGKYDVAVTAGPSFTTKRQESVETMAQVLQGNPQLMAVMGDLFFGQMDWHGADQIAERLKKTLPPELQDDDPDMEIPPEIQQMQKQLEMAAQQLEQRAQELQQAEQQIKAEAENNKHESTVVDLKKNLAIKTIQVEEKAIQGEIQKLQQAREDLEEKLDMLQQTEQVTQGNSEMFAGLLAGIQEMIASQIEMLNGQSQQNQQLINGILAPKKTTLIRDDAGNPVGAVSEPVMQ